MPIGGNMAGHPSMPIYLVQIWIKHVWKKEKPKSRNRIKRKERLKMERILLLHLLLMAIVELWDWWVNEPVLSLSLYVTHHHKAAARPFAFPKFFFFLSFNLLPTIALNLNHHQSLFVYYYLFNVNNNNNNPSSP